MAQKTYTSLYFLFRTSVKVNGVRKPIEFGNGINFGEYKAKGTFTTSDEALQEAIENDPRFGWEIFLVSETGTTAAPQKETGNDDNNPESVTTLDEARKFLMRRYKAERKQLQHLNAVLQYAEQCGVRFPNLKQ